VIKLFRFRPSQTVQVSAVVDSWLTRWAGKPHSARMGDHLRAASFLVPLGPKAFCCAQYER
jgi:hypothetical protein